MSIEAIQVNDLDEAGFVATFGHVLEDSPHLAAAAWQHRPFADAGAVCDAFATVVGALDETDTLALLRAHPELGSRAPMGADSVDEQASAGLDRATEATADRLRSGNAAYRERFGVPFIIAVRGRSTDEVLEELARRLERDPATELAEAVTQVIRIAELRVRATLDGAS